MMCETIGFPKWMYFMYDNSKKLINNKNLDSCKEIFCCAYREYDENNGATGGPAGVLHMQEKLIGNKLKGTKITYIFKPKEYRVPDNIWESLFDIDGKVKMVIAGAGYILSHSKIRKSIEVGNNPILICHDIGSAYGAYLLGVKYVLIYHQQGSILNEISSVGFTCSDKDKEIIQYIEKMVFLSAYKVYFPSKGARNVFIETTLMDKNTLDKINFAEEVLYNTIEERNYIENINKIFNEWKINLIETQEIFLSIGDYIEDKGLDRIPKFLDFYKKATGKNIVWISIGNELGNDRIKWIKQDCEQRNISCFLINKRIPHEHVLAIMDRADYYIMMHRKSIFDLATLEAMRSGKKILLSDCEANKEFNVLDNIVLIQEDFDYVIKEIVRHFDFDWEHLNRQAFKKFFSKDSFVKRYVEMIKELLIFNDKKERYESSINKKYLLEWKDKYKGKKCIICGAGQSLDYIKEKEKDCIYIALNKALFYPNVHFDFLFMQDAPRNQEYTLEDYNRYDCVKFYGIITNPLIKVEGLGNEKTEYNCVVNKIYRYELAPVVFDYKIDFFEEEIDYYCFADAQSVLFSAIQFAIYAGFKEIELCGVDFSKINYGNVCNESYYAINVQNNLLKFKKNIHKLGKVKKFGFLQTTNQKLFEEFYNMEYQKQEVIVTGIYTQNYASLVKLQRMTCLDDYKFEFRFISDEEWDKSKGNAEFAFFEGNTLKTQLVIDKIKEHWGKFLIVTDADLIFLTETKGQLLHELENTDMLFLRERSDEERKYERAIANINIGFVVIRCNDSSLLFWSQVQEETIKSKGWDQEIANKIIFENKIKVKYKILPECYLNGASINKKNFKEQKICTACGSIAKKLGLSKEEFLLEAFNNYHKNEWFY